MPNQTGVTQEQFITYASSEQAQIKELIFFEKCNLYVNFSILFTLMVILVFNGFNRMR